MPVQVMEAVRVVPYVRTSIFRRGSRLESPSALYGSPPCLNLNNKRSITQILLFPTAMAFHARLYGAGLNSNASLNQ